MSFGGPPTTTMTSTAASVPPSSTTKQVKLERESELRIKEANDTLLRLKLLNDIADIFGTELPLEIVVFLSKFPHREFEKKGEKF